jgi:hypothetical protein
VNREPDDILDAVEQRAEIITKLLASLDGERDSAVEAAWAAEIENRARRVLNGGGKFEDWETIRDQLRPNP